MMIERTLDNLTFFQFENLHRHPTVVHGVFTRRGGVSPPPFDSLNMGFMGGDARENVVRNRAVVTDCLGIHNTVFVKQVHGTTVLPVTGSTNIRAAETVEADAMVTDRPDALLCIKLADCQAVLLYDPIRRVIANIHSGWRGSIANIIRQTVTVMTDQFGCNPADMIAGIGPSLGPCCAEFINYKNEIPRPFWSYKDAENRFDFWQISRGQLQATGVPDANIETAGICTRCRSDLFFSYRQEGRTGRFLAALSLMVS
ncbi:MAG: peptidoglycan editing factor PgeF [Thermodesulfobacteriota bacterium]|nr:peptidoglycan editing factor PgeF [Thermodesulfobacteriota bacterium]